MGDRMFKTRLPYSVEVIFATYTAVIKSFIISNILIQKYNTSLNLQFKCVTKCLCVP